MVSLHTHSHTATYSTAQHTTGEWKAAYSVNDTHEPDSILLLAAALLVIPPALPITHPGRCEAEAPCSVLWPELRLRMESVRCNRLSTSCFNCRGAIVW